jgi:methyl-accepting chemotaxis protein
MQESAQAAAQISVSAQQQLAGMDQLAMAMDNIRIASSQNLKSSAQAETAAQSLHELGQKLKLMLARFQV